MNRHQIWCIIPAYNNGKTIENIAIECRKHIDRLLIIDDGSTDINVTSLFTDSDITVIRHDINQGKGKALKTALIYAKEHDATHMIDLLKTCH